MLGDAFAHQIFQNVFVKTLRKSKSLPESQLCQAILRLKEILDREVLSLGYVKKFQLNS